MSDLSLFLSLFIKDFSIKDPSLTTPVKHSFPEANAWLSLVFLGVCVFVTGVTLCTTSIEYEKRWDRSVRKHFITLPKCHAPFGDAVPVFFFAPSPKKVAWRRRMRYYVPLVKGVQ